VLWYSSSTGIQEFYRVQGYRRIRGVQESNSGTGVVQIQSFSYSTYVHRNRSSAGVQRCRCSTGVQLCRSSKVVYEYWSITGLHRYRY